MLEVSWEDVRKAGQDGRDGLFAGEDVEVKNA
jgi:hypothetical protein